MSLAAAAERSGVSRFSLPSYKAPSIRKYSTRRSFDAVKNLMVNNEPHRPSPRPKLLQEARLGSREALSV
jgi:hypothetical protein